MMLGCGLENGAESCMPYRTLREEVREKLALEIASACTDREFSRMVVPYMCTSLWPCDSVVSSLTLTARSGRTKSK